MPTYVVLLGPPGAGKGTQAKIVSRELDLPHISSGDIFRENLKLNTDLGVMAKVYIDRGELVPDDVTITMIRANPASVRRGGNDSTSSVVVTPVEPEPEPEPEPGVVPSDGLVVSLDASALLSSLVSPSTNFPSLSKDVLRIGKSLMTDEANEESFN